MLFRSDRFPAHRVVAVSALVAASATGLIALAVDGAPWAVTLRFVTGVALAGVYPAVRAARLTPTQALATT